MKIMGESILETQVWSRMEKIRLCTPLARNYVLKVSDSIYSIPSKDNKIYKDWFFHGIGLNLGWSILENRLADPNSTLYTYISVSQNYIDFAVLDHSLIQDGETIVKYSQRWALEPQKDYMQFQHKFFLPVATCLAIFYNG